MEKNKTAVQQAQQTVSPGEIMFRRPGGDSSKVKLVKAPDASDAVQGKRGDELVLSTQKN